MGSMKTKAIIIDDEKQARVSLAHDLSYYCKSIEIIGEADSVKSAVNMIHQLSPDLIFLDVELRDGNGFNILEQIGDKKIKVIFTTAYDKFAIRAFKFSAVDYLLKPIDANELVEAVKKTESISDESELKASLKTLVENTKSRQPLNEKIVLHTSEGSQIAKINNIIRLESERNYTKLFFLDEKPLLVAKTLKEFEDLLKEHQFERTHQSHLVNMNQVKKYVNRDGGYLLMTDNSSVPIAQRKKTEILALFSSM